MRPALLLLAACLLAQAETPEEARLPAATQAMPQVVAAFAGLNTDFAYDWSHSRDAREATELARNYGRRLWLGAKARMREQQDMDDRPLYWARLALSHTVRDSQPGFPIFAADRQAVLAALEQSSRGMDEIQFDADRHIKRILVTGFDPFALDRRIEQSNPSGVNALRLDGEEFDIDGQRVRIETAIFPVRYADFDAGVVEHFLQPWLGGQQNQPQDWREAARGLALVRGKVAPQVDMVLTVSMGSKDFDLERYPGRRRSATAPDNLKVLAGGSRAAPIPPLLYGQPIAGPEFVEFSLPVAAMLRVQKPYPVNDHIWVRIVPDTRFAPGGLAALQGKTAVEGGGGGYLSNEISYRAVRLRDELGLRNLPVGHLHTPALIGFDADKLRAITDQIKALLIASQRPS